MTFDTVFPDYDPTTLPAIPAGWSDTSFLTDSCPKFSVDHGPGWEVIVWVDYADPAARRLGYPERFHISIDDREGGQGLYASDDWRSVVLIAQRFADEFKAWRR